MIKILIVDDHAIVRDGLRQILDGSPGMAVSGEARNGSELLELLRNNNKKKYDMVLLDLSLPGRGGLDLLKQLKSEFPKLAVLVLSMYPEDQYAVRALKAGAAGYLTKESASDQLVEAVRKAASGGKFISPSLAEKLAFHLETGLDDSPHETLSDREYQVLCLIGSGKTVAEIAGELSLSVKTISTYRGRILAKMGMENNAQLTHYVLKQKLAE